MKKIKHVLFISYDGMTDPLGQSQVIPYLAGLTKYSYQFTILSCEKKSKYKKNHSYVEKMLGPYPIEWVPVTYHKIPPVLSSVYDYLNLRRMAAVLHKKRNFDMVHTRPGVPTLVALWLKKRFGIKFLNDIRGFWADERVDGGMWNLKNPLFKSLYLFFKKHETECIKKADHNVCLTYKAREEILRWPQLSSIKINIEVIPCSVDLELFDPARTVAHDTSELKAELNINADDFILSYLGSIGGWYLVDEMMEFFKVLLTVIPNSKFLFISPHRHDVITSRASKFGIAADKIISREGRRDEIPALLSLSSFSIFFIRKCYSKISSSPTKHGEIMAMGVPVITNDGVGDVKMIVEKYQSGIVLPKMDEANYRNALTMITSGTGFNKSGIREGAKEFYSLNKAVQKYRGVYDQILNS